MPLTDRELTLWLRVPAEIREIGRRFYLEFPEELRPENTVARNEKSDNVGITEISDFGSKITDRRSSSKKQTTK